MQKLKIEQERQARETEEQLRQFEEQKTLEMMKLEMNTEVEDELYPENLEKNSCTRPLRLLGEYQLQ